MRLGSMRLGYAALLTAIAACTASGTDEEAPREPGDASDQDGGAPADAGSSDASPDVTPDAESPLICGDAGFCETRLPVASTGLPLSLRSVWMAGDSDVWSVSLEGLVLHYDGTSWKTEFNANHELYAVWATTTSVWVGGESGILLHRTSAGEWSRVEVGHVAPIRAIYGTADDDVWFTRQDSSVDHFDGTTLTTLPSGVAELELTTVFGRPGFGTYAAGRVRPVFTGSGTIPDQPYVFVLSTTGLTVFNTSLTTKRGFSPFSGFVTDSEIDDQRIFLAGYDQFRTSPDNPLNTNVKYCVVGSANAVTFKSFGAFSIEAATKHFPEWTLAAWVRGWNDIRLLPTTANAIRWDGTTFTRVPFSMGYERPSSTVFAAHNGASAAWVVGNGFALKGALP